MEKLEHNSLHLAKQIQDSEPHLKSNLIIQYLKDQDFAYKFPDIPTECQWINASEEFSSIDLDGKVVLLDFFTYCCINCIHMFPFLHKLESEYSVKDGFVVVGVHSAKFPNEKDTNNIKHALQRYNILHPVLNDSKIEMWNLLNVSCWPTLIVLNPRKEVLLSLPGESYANVVKLFIDEAMKFYSNSLSHHLIPFVSSTDVDLGMASEQLVKLQFPSKVAISKENYLAIADTGNHRVIICLNNGTVQYVVGTGNPGQIDGNFKTAQFNAPHGLAWNTANSLFVADCENHLIRKIDLTVKRVVTVVGVGKQSNDLEGGKLGTEQGISSPWALQVGGSPKFPDQENILYIAMPGVHQIWAFFLKNADWQKGTEHEMMTCLRFAGSGQEENRNNSYPHKAGFAQPSGLAVDSANHKMYVADSESSTIRKVNLSNGAVEAVVGGHFDPMNLFAYGDVDGKARDAKLQHPLGVAWDHKRSRLYVADSYNHKIKVVDPAKKMCTTILGPTPNKQVEEDLYPNGFPAVELNEPGGTAVDKTCSRLYVADTNNHRILVVDLNEGTVNEVVLSFDVTETDGVKSDSDVIQYSPIVNKKRAFVKEFLCCDVASHQDIRIEFKVKGMHLTEEAPSSWQVSVRIQDRDPVLVTQGTFTAIDADFKTLLSVPQMLSTLITTQNNTFLKQQEKLAVVLTVEANLYYCLEDAKVCSLKGVVCNVPLIIFPEVESTNTDVVLQLNVAQILK